MTLEGLGVCVYSRTGAAGHSEGRRPGNTIRPHSILQTHKHATGQL